MKEEVRVVSLSGLISKFSQCHVLCTSDRNSRDVVTVCTPPSRHLVQVPRLMTIYAVLVHP